MMVRVMLIVLLADVVVVVMSVDWLITGPNLRRKLKNEVVLVHPPQQVASGRTTTQCKRRHSLISP